MATFSYTALKPDGSTATGDVDVADRAEAIALLDRKGWQPVALNVKGEAGAAAVVKAGDDDDGIPKGPIKLKKAQVVLFTEELSDLLAAGLQLEPALRIMESREESGSIKDVTRILRQEVRDGTNFSTALRRTSPNFGDLYCNLAQAGEVSGALPTILKRQAQYLVSMQELQGKVLFALIYPAFLFIVGMGVAALFVTFLIPKLTELLNSTGGEMPLPAQIVMGMSDFIKAWWWLAIILVVVAIISFKTYVKAEENRETWDRVKLNIPFVGDIFKRRFYVQFMETLGNLVGNGLPLLKAMELSRNATTNLHIRTVLAKINDQVGEGGALSRALKRSGFFPSLLIDMVTVGEQTGDIAQSFERTATRYDKELEKAIAALTALIQPVIIVVMASLVGIMAYTMVSTIFETISSIQTR
ncbi:MAG: type II secretion system F family protein [Verrucomicrobiota bacterium]